MVEKLRKSKHKFFSTIVFRIFYKDVLLVVGSERALDAGNLFVEDKKVHKSVSLLNRF